MYIYIHIHLYIHIYICGLFLDLEESRLDDLVELLVVYTSMYLYIFTYIYAIHINIFTHVSG